MFCSNEKIALNTLAMHGFHHCCISSFLCDCFVSSVPRRVARSIGPFPRSDGPHAAEAAARSGRGPGHPDRVTDSVTVRRLPRGCRVARESGVDASVVLYTVHPAAPSPAPIKAQKGPRIAWSILSLSPVWFWFVLARLDLTRLVACLDLVDFFSYV